MNKVWSRLTSQCKVLVSVTFCLFNLSAGMLQDLCLSGCNCEHGIADCSFTSLTNVTGYFPNVIVDIKISGFHLKDFGPITYGNSTETISIYRGTFSTLSSLAFSSLHSVRVIQFSGVTIQSIHSDAFKDIVSHASISFTYCIIENIGSGAFYHLKGLKEIHFGHSLITIISSYAFSDIQTHIFNITDTEITSLQNFSIHSLYNLEILELNSLVVETVSNSVFQNMKNISRVKLTNCHFKTLPCLVLTGLREATPGDHDTFQFTKSKIGCDCSVAPFLEYIKRHPNSVTDSVECFQMSALFNGSLKSVNVDEITNKCPNSTCVLEDTSSLPSIGMGADGAGSVINSFFLIALLLGISIFSCNSCK